MAVDRETAHVQLLDAAEDLFYRRGIQSVGMDDIRSASGISLKRLYQLYPAKEQLVEAYLERRDGRWRGRLADYVAGHATEPRARLLAVFDWLERWFGEPDFRGCAWINGYGELGAVSSAVAGHARAHKAAFQDYLRGLVAAAALPAELADQLYLLAEGAMVTAGIFHSTEPAARAKAAAHTLITATPASP
jgi:AcrR family transcriptional regulator